MAIGLQIQDSRATRLCMGVSNHQGHGLKYTMIFVVGPFKDSQNAAPIFWKRPYRGCFMATANVLEGNRDPVSLPEMRTGLHLGAERGTLLKINLEAHRGPCIEDASLPRGLSPFPSSLGGV